MKYLGVILKHVFAITTKNSGPPEDFKFDGMVEIFVTCKEATDKLYLHINKLEIDNSTIVFRAVDENHTPPGISHMLKRNTTIRIHPKHK